jgi:hypothetical protein
MGLIHFIREFVEWRRMQRRFRSYCDPKLTLAVLEDPSAAFEPPQRMELDFALALLQDQGLETIPGQLAASVAAIRKHSGLVLTLDGPIVFAVFGYPLPDPEASSARRACAGELRIGAKVLHGRGLALVGLYPEVPAMVILSGFGALLAELAELRPGEVREKEPLTTLTLPTVTPSPPTLPTP